MQTITVKQGQSILDIAIVYTGTVTTVYEIAVLNAVSITDDLIIGQLLQVPDVVDKTIVALFGKKNQPATAITDSETTEIGGIGYMSVGGDFKVS